MALNEAWHRDHPMPSHPTREQRIAWHRAHAEQCGCRPVPESIRAEMHRRSNDPRTAGG